VTDEEVAALVAEVLSAPEWSTVAGGSLGFGYKDNVFLAHDNPKGAAFASAGAELLALRYAPLGPRYNFFATGDTRHFFGNDVSHQEYTAFGQALAERDFNERFLGSLAAQFYYQDQVMDVSVSETNRQAIPVLGETINLRPGTRWQLAEQFSLALEAYGTRQYYNQPLDDYWEAGAKLAASHQFGHDSKITASYEPSWRAYDTDPALTATGAAITNSHRESVRHDLRLAWQQHWDAQKALRTVIGGGVRLNRENGGGYFDYVRWAATAKILYRAKAWELSAEGRFANYDYTTQTISATDAEKRNRSDWTAILGVERRLNEQLVWTLNYEYEAATSNDPLETYTVNTVSTALRWDF
jgi:opacity protein-like surface antigen